MKLLINENKIIIASSIINIIYGLFEKENKYKIFINDNFYYININPDNHKIIETNIKIPNDFKNYKYKYIDEEFVLNENYEEPSIEDMNLDINSVKESKLNEVKLKFNNAVKYGKFFSTSLQIEVDCRRNDRDNDIQNITNLIQICELDNIQVIIYKGYEESAEITLIQLKELLIEMQRYGLNLYNKKWYYETFINDNEDIQEIYNLNISFEV